MKFRSEAADSLGMVFVTAILALSFTLLAQVHAEDEISSRDQFTVVSWRIKTGKLDYDRAAKVLGDGDIALVQNIEFNKDGGSALLILAGLIEQRINEPLCKAWFLDSKNKRGRVGLLWRQSQFSLVESDGTLKTNCGAHPRILRGEDGQVARAQFLHKKSSRLFLVNQLSLLEAPKRPAQSVPGFFKTEREARWPVLFAADLQLNSKNEAFTDPRAWGFKPSVPQGLGGNLWYKNVTALEVKAVQLRKRFPEISAAYIRDNLSDALPVRGEFSLSPDDGTLAQTQILIKHRGASRKEKSEDKPLASTPAIAAYPAPVGNSQLSNLDDDIGEEAGAINKERQPDSTKKKKKAHKHPAH